MISLHNPNLIAFVGNMQRQEVVICGCLPSELFLISRAVGGPVFQVLAHVFILLSSRRGKPFCSWWHLKVFHIANDMHNFSVTHSSIYSICIGVTHCAHCHCALLSLCCTAFLDNKRLEEKANKTRQLDFLWPVFPLTLTWTFVCLPLLFYLCGRCSADGNLRGPQEGSSWAGRKCECRYIFVHAYMLPENVS